MLRKSRIALCVSLAIAIPLGGSPAFATPVNTATSTVSSTVSAETNEPPSIDLSDDMITVPGADSIGSDSSPAVAEPSIETVWVSYVDVTTASADNANGKPTTADVQALVKKLNDYWAAESNGLVTVVYAGLETTRALKRPSCDPESVFDAEAAAAFGGRFAENAWVDTHEHLLILTAENKACGGSAFGTVGGNGGMIFTAQGIGNSIGVPALLHEFGHNIGFLHGDSSICTNTSRFDATIRAYTFNSSVCPTEEYGDLLDIMGYTVSGSSPHLSIPQRISAGYMTNYASPTTNGTVTLTTLGGDSGTQGISVVDPVSRQRYFVEYRGSTGRDAGSAEYTWEGSTVNSYRGYGKYSSTTNAAKGGVRILRILPFPEFGANGTTALAVGVVNGNPKNRDTHLDAGESFINYTGGLVIRVGTVSPTTGAQVSVLFPAATKATLSLGGGGKQVYGSAIRSTATATVALVNGMVPAGTMAFYAGTTRVASVPVGSNGAAKFAFSAATAAGKLAITATFTPSNLAAYQASTSTASTLVVSKATATTIVSLPVSSVKKSKKAVVNVVVKVSGVAAPTGTLAAYSGSTKLATYTLVAANKGKIAISLPKFSKKGTKTITVRYLGGANINADDSPAVKLTIK